MESEIEGEAEFIVRCKGGKIQLLIHKNRVIAEETKKDVYEELFDFVVDVLGGRID